MKKIFIVILSAFLYCIPAFAEYVPIPKHLSKQYKAEIEQIIDEEYPKVIKNIDNIMLEAKKLHDNILKNGYTIDEYINLVLIPETNIPTADLDLYAKLLKITQEKYLGIKYIPIGTDSVNAINDILLPYFAVNNVNTNKLTKILIYENKKIKLVEKYIQEVEQIRPISD